jgi:microcystin-dependent protein
MALTFPANPANGQIYDQYIYDATSQSWRIYGSDTALSLIPAGSIMMWFTDTPPAGWLLCNGQSTAGYGDLAAVVGANVPNLQGRVPVGKDTSQTEFDALGETGGAKTHTLTVDQMPSHTHTQNSHNHSHRQWIFNGAGHGGGNRYGFGYAANTGAANDTGAASSSGEVQYGNYPTTATNQNTGGGQAHNNLQPYLVLNYIIKT